MIGTFIIIKPGIIDKVTRIAGVIDITLFFFLASLTALL